MLGCMLYLWCELVVCCLRRFMFCLFFFKQKTAYEMRISDWSSDVCSSDLAKAARAKAEAGETLADEVEALLARRASAALGLARKAGELVTEIGRASCRERVCQYV